MKRTISIGKEYASANEAVSQTISTDKVQRVENIDLLRGFVIVLMALDHVRFFFSTANFDPMDMTQTSPLWFMTRWITHLCAPSFIFLAGMGMGYSNKPKEKLGPFLLSRGIWLVFLEITIINFGWGAGFVGGTTMLGVLWALGVSMIFMSVGIYMNRKILLILCLGLVIGHNLLDTYDEGLMYALGISWSILHKQHSFNFLGQQVYLIYPLIPWVGLMGLGYLMGKWQRLRENPKLYLKMGLSLIFMFTILRLGSFYGDSKQWSDSHSGIFSFLSFIKVSKYPPSLHYLLITLGISCSLLFFLRKLKGFPAFILGTFGRVPLFFYVLHIPFIHALAVIWFNTFHGLELNWWLSAKRLPHETLSPNLLTVYLAWLLTLILLFPLVKKYDGYKSRTKSWWVGYL